MVTPWGMVLADNAATRVTLSGQGPQMVIGAPKALNRRVQLFLYGVLFMPCPEIDVAFVHRFPTAASCINGISEMMSRLRSPPCIDKNYAFSWQTRRPYGN
jgi:hypothetical protein